MANKEYSTDDKYYTDQEQNMISDQEWNGCT